VNLEIFLFLMNTKIVASSSSKINQQLLWYKLERCNIYFIHWTRHSNKNIFEFFLEINCNL
jgi:hypothetical protein